MQLTQLRNATILLELGDHRILVDPMLSKVGAMPGFRLFGGERRRNPLTPLPAETSATLAEATVVLVTHEHPDHLDPPGLKWIRSRGLPVWCCSVDAKNLTRKGLNVRPLSDGFEGMTVEVIRSKHGRGLVGWLMGPVHAFFIAHPDEPSVLLTGDTILSPALLDAVERLSPDVIVAPAGSANMGVGGPILMTEDELVELVKRAPGDVVFNHLEALDHCPTTHAGLAARMEAEGLSERTHIPADGERITLERRWSTVPIKVAPSSSRGAGFQKWFTAKYSGTS